MLGNREINNGEKYITLDISLKLGILDKMKVASADPKDYFGISGKGLITSLGIKTNVSSNKNKKSSHTITNVRMNNISKIIK